jgi:DNA-binding CsgD family transcriptional regulator
MIQGHLLNLVATPASDVGRFVEELCVLLGLCVNRVEQIDSIKSIEESKSVVLWAYDSFSKPQSEIIHSNPAHHIACGTPPDFVAENQFLSAGYAGVISSENMASILVKAIESILRGELWYSRRALGRFAATALGYKSSYRFGVCTHSAEMYERLTPKERQIAKLLFVGLSNKEIAADARISLHTAKAHIYNIFRKLKVSSRTEAMNLAQKIQPLLEDQRAVRDTLRA